MLPFDFSDKITLVTEYISQPFSWHVTLYLVVGRHKTGRLGTLQRMTPTMNRVIRPLLPRDALYRFFTVGRYYFPERHIQCLPF